MDEDTRQQWNIENWVIDRLVDAVEAGDTDGKQALGQRLMDGIDRDNWNGGRFIEVGQFLPLTFLDAASIDDDDMNWLCGDETVTLSRANEILADGVSGVELTRWRERVAERAFDPGEFDRDMLWCLIAVRRTGGREAYVAAFGYGLSPLTYVAAYDTYTESMNALKAMGFISLKDYGARCSDLLARDMT